MSENNLQINGTSATLYGNVGISDIPSTLLRNLIVDTNDIISDEIIQQLTQHNRMSISIVRYPDIKRFTYNVRSSNCYIVIEYADNDVEISGNSKISYIHIDTRVRNIEISNMESLSRLSLYYNAKKVEIINCPHCRCFNLKTVEHLILDSNSVKKRYLTINSDEIYKYENNNKNDKVTMYYNTISPYYLKGLYGMSIKINKFDDILNYDADIFNVNILNISVHKDIRTLDLTKFNLDKVTTFILKGNCSVHFSENALCKNISWTSPFIKGFKLPEMSQLKFLYVTVVTSEDFIVTEKLIYDNADLYINALSRSSLKMEMIIQRTYNDKRDILERSIVDTTKLLEAAENMMPNRPKNAYNY